MLGHLAFKKLYQEMPKHAFVRMIEESVKNYLRQYRELAAAIKVPTVLLYIGKDAPLPMEDYDASYEKGLGAVLGVHPHMVTEALLEQLQELFDSTRMVYTRKGADRRLLEQHTGGYTEIVRRRDYVVKTHSAYISPYLHGLAATALYDDLQPLLA
jgi:hypothetical protein